MRQLNNLTQPERDELVIEWRLFAWNIAWAYYRRRNNCRLSLDDLRRAGEMGLVLASQRFDPLMGWKFSTYATYWIKQNIRRELELSARHGFSTMPPDVYPTRIENGQSYKDSSLPDLPDVEPSREERPGDTLESDEYYRWLLDKLPDRLRSIVAKRVDGMTLREIADELGVCRERVRQLEERALNILRKRVTV